MNEFELINPINDKTDLSKCEIHKCNWDVVIEGKPYQVVRIKGKYHTIGGGCGNNDFYAYPLDEKMSVDNLWQLEDYRIAPRWGFRIEHNAYRKCKWDDRLIRTNYCVTITRNDEDFYSFGCNDMTYGVAKAQTLIVDFSEHVIPFSQRNWQDQVVNRKIYYYEQPAVITEFLGGDDLRVIIKMCDPNYIPERWKNSEFPISWGDEENNQTTIQLKEDEIDNFLKNKLTCNFIRTFTQNARAWGIKSITASGYNPANGKGVRFQDVDYSQYDVCVTNPPFSLYAEFMECIVDKIDFICLAPFLNRVTPNIGLPLMLKKAYLGYGAGIGDMKFDNPTKDNQYKVKTIAVDWITSFPEAQDERNILHENKVSGISYETYRDDYLVMENMTMKDGTHPIRVPCNSIPDDYDGWMFTSIQFLEKYDLRKYEWYGTNFKGYYNKQNSEANPFNHKVSDEMIKANGKQMFHGIVFRKKPEVNE